jgi:hypothetical protein
MDHFKINAKSYASGFAAAVGSISIILATQHMPEQGIQFITQYEWSTVVLAVLASYGITWRVPNQTPQVEAPAKQGDHVAS